MVSLSPNGFRLRLHTALGAQHGHTAVQHAQGALHLDRKVHVTRGVDDIDAGVTPETGGRGGGDGDTTLLLLLHPVHGRRSLMGIADLMGLTGIVQDTLGQRGLTSIDVCHDTDVSRIMQRIFSWQLYKPSLLN